MMDKSDEEKPSLEISQATTSNAGTSQDLFLQNQKRKMEEGGINMAHNGRQKADVRIARSQTFPRTCHHSIMIGSIARSPTFPSPSATNRIASNSRPSQGEDPSPSPTNGRERTLDKYRAQCSPLLQAAIKGDWPDAKAFLENCPEYVRAPITKEKWTVLHAAVIAERTSFVKELLKLMRRRDDYHDLMELKTNYGFTALHCAAQSGIVRIAEELVEINREPLWIPDNKGDVPLNVAAYLGRHANMVLHLLPLTYHHREQLTKENRTELLEYTIYNELYDIALKILEMDAMIPNIYVESDETKCGWTVLVMLARKPFAIGSESQLSYWKSLLKYSWFKGIYNKALMKTLAHQLVERLWAIFGIPEMLFSSNLAHCEINEVIFEAAKVGNVEFLIILSHSYPDLLWQLNENNMSIFHIAVEYRHENVFNLIYEIGTAKDSIASHRTSITEENMLHLAGKLPPSYRLNIVSGAALQMQRELLWFKEIEKILPASFVNEKNFEHKTPKELFLETHTSLQIEGEKWMKDTANYCMLVATLIATVIFAATITIPGGNNQELGTPIFLRRTWFMVFFISNAIALGSSSTSIVIFLSILTSRYTEEDFLTSLPSKLVFGLATLFVSMVGMMVAFVATCFLVYSTKRAWAPVIVITSASLPVTLFVLLHHKLWVDTFLSTYKSKFLFRPNKHRLFQRKITIGESIRRKFQMKENCWSFTGC